MKMTERPEAPPTQRNKWPILDILSKELIENANILEIGSGTGQHAIFFAEKLPLITWFTSDLEGNHAGIRLWLEAYHGSNVRLPINLEMGVNDHSFNKKFDHIFSSNTSHIMSYEAVKRMFSMTGRLLPLGGKFYLYGPFNINDQFTSKSNQEFDSMLKNQDSLMGLRDIGKLDILAKKVGMSKYDFHEMPSNNYLSVWRKDKFI